MERIISFDCYGTIIDWERGIVDTINSVFPNRMTREEILKNYAIIEAKLEKEYRPYREILTEVIVEFSRLLDEEINDEDKLALVKSLPEWPPFEDSVRALKKIKNFSPIAIISNVDNDLIQRTIENLGVEFDFVVTAQMVGAYKPSLRVFQYAQKIFNLPKEHWIHAAQSIYHDIIPANNLGIKSVLIKRRGHGATPAVKANAHMVFNNLEDFSEWVEGTLK